MKHKYLIILAIAAFVTLLYPPLVSATPYLDSAQSFAVLGASTVTNTGSTTIYGSVGVYPGSSITGFPPGIVTGGVIYPNPPPAPSDQAQSDALNAYNIMKILPYTDNKTGVDLGGLTLSPGVYFFATSASLTGTLALTLDFASDPDGAFVFQVGTALTTGSSTAVNVINGSPESGVYWLMGVTGGTGTGSATLGSASVFAGNILALTSIGLDPTAAILCGRAIALEGAVTMSGDNKISNNNFAQDFGSGRKDFGSFGFSGGGAAAPVPEPSTMLLISSGLAGLVAFRKRFKKA
jgi:hypothetical protein